MSAGRVLLVLGQGLGVLLQGPLHGLVGGSVERGGDARPEVGEAVHLRRGQPLQRVSSRQGGLPLPGYPVGLFCCLFKLVMLPVPSSF